MNAKKYLLLPLVLAVFIVFFFYWNIQTFFLKTESSPSFWVDIYGKVSPDSSAMNQIPPQYVRIYSYMDEYGFDQLCSKPDAVLRGIANISWANSSSGEYRISIEFPVSMNIDISTDCSDCNQKRVYIDSNESKKNVDLLWGNRTCGNAVTTYDNYYDENAYAEALSRNFIIPLNDISVNQSIIIQNYKTTSDNILQDAGKEKERNLTNAYKKVLQSQMFFQEAKYDIELYKLGKCIEDFHDILEKYNNSVCYVPDYSAVEIFNESNRTYTSYSDDNYYINYVYRMDENIDVLKNTVSIISNGRDNMQQYVGNCNQALQTLENSFNFQSKYCEQKKASVWVLNISFVVLFLSLGILLGILIENKFNIVRKINLKLNKFDTFLNGLHGEDTVLFFSFLLSILLFYIIMILAIQYLLPYLIAIVPTLIGLVRWHYDKKHSKNKHKNIINVD